MWTEQYAGMEINMSREDEGLKQLGNKTKYSMDYAPGVLETFENKHPDNDYFVKFNCPEFTSLCPITGQPDFATIYISYIPDKLMVESKSLKLYLFSFRNHGDFHEDCVNIIMKDLIRLMWIQPGVSGIDGIANLPAARQADATVAPGTARAPRTAEGRRQIKTAGSPEGRVQQAARPARHSPLPGYGERAVIL